MKEKGVPDFRRIKSQTFSTITNLIDFVNTEIYVVHVSNYSVCFSKLKNLFHGAGINVVNTFINSRTEIPWSINLHANFARFYKNFL